MKNKTIAIIGSPGCGKTSNAVKLALSLAKFNQNVAIVLLERAVPPIPYILSTFKEQTVSLGDLLTRPVLSQKEIAQSCMEVPRHKHITVLGYQFGDWHDKYPKMVFERVYDFFYQLKSLVPYVIIDCSSLIEVDPASILALEEADFILRFGSADLKGMSYFHTLDKLMINQQTFPREKQLTLVSNCSAGQNWQRVASVYGNVFDVLPHCPDLAYQFDEMSLWSDLTSREGLKYMDVMNRLTNRITGSIKTKEIFTEVKYERDEERKAEKKNGLFKPLHSIIKAALPGDNPSSKKEPKDKGKKKKSEINKNGEW